MAPKIPSKSSHLGLKVTEDVRKKLDDLVTDEAKRAPYANVSASSVIVGLIVVEHERRFPPKKK